MVTYQAEQDPTANNWNLLRAIPNAPAWNPGNTPDMVISKVLNALYDDGQSGTTSFADLTGQPTDNAALKTTLGLYLLASNNLSDLKNKSIAQSNLGLGTMAVLNAPMSGNANAGQGVIGTDTRLNDARVPEAGSIVGAAGQVVVTEALDVFTVALPSTVTGVTTIPALAITESQVTNLPADLAARPLAYLGKITGCDLNAATPADNACPISAAKYILRKIVITNVSTSLAALNPVMAIYDAAAAGGDLLATITAASFNLLTAAAKFIQYIGNEFVINLTDAFSLAEFCSQNTLSAPALYARLTTATGSAATCDIYFYGDTL